MNLILLETADFIAPDRVRLTGRRLEHVLSVHRGAVGDELTVGVLGGDIGKGTVLSIDDTALEMEIRLDSEPPRPLRLALILALPRPKVLNRMLSAISSLGVKEIYLINSWRVEKSFWSTPRLAWENVRHQLILGLEQGRDTILPRVEVRRRFRPFVEDELPDIARDTFAIVAHPYGDRAMPRKVAGRVTLVVGPEGGFIEREIAMLEQAGLIPMTAGDRVLRVETVVPYLIGRLF